MRALVRENIAIYTATMEDNGVADITNPRVEESHYFLNLYETEKEDQRFNHTPPTPGDPYVPDWSAYLHWQNGTEADGKSIGPATMLRVNAGDRIDIETWARYETGAQTARLDLMLLSQFLGTDFVNVGGFEGYTAAQTSDALQQALTSAAYTNGADPDRPFAYLNYILFDEDMVAVPGGSRFKQIPLEAGFDPGEEHLPNMHARLSFDSPVTPEQSGFLYIWVSNESENRKVWFDDLRVTHTMSAVVSEATDYGVWGDVLRQQKTDPMVFYKYGYQGQFSEADMETGWNHFELREYDPIVGRTTTTDPSRQFHSPYMWVGNNPIRGTDPTGGVSPIYDMDGNFLGTDDEGLQGDAIFMDASQFTQGMAHASALEAGFTFSQFSFFDISLEASAAVFNHQNGLSIRPDWDGFVTIDEGVAWAKAHPGALSNPTPDNSLYINSALLDFGDVSTSLFDGLNKTTPVNLFSLTNTYESTTNTTLRATVYALGRVNMALVHRENRQIRIVNDAARDYDWNGGGGIVRSNFIRAEKARTGLNDSHGFKAYYYGIGTLRE